MVLILLEFQPSGMSCELMIFFFFSPEGVSGGLWVDVEEVRGKEHFDWARFTRHWQRGLGFFILTRLLPSYTKYGSGSEGLRLSTSLTGLVPAVPPPSPRFKKKYVCSP